MLPMKFRVLGRDILTHYVTFDEMPKAWGEYDYDFHLIKIREGQPVAFEADTVLHELIHAIDDAMQLGMNERQVHCTATGIVALLKDNPDFVKYLTNAIEYRKENVSINYL